jgi:hypothetical protein
VAVTVAVEEFGDVPNSFVAVTLIVYATPEESVCTVTGEDAPEAVLVVCPAAVAVTVKEVAAGELAGKEKDTFAAPLVNGLPVPIFAAVTLTGARGGIKSFCCDDFPPASFFAIYRNPSFNRCLNLI